MKQTNTASHLLPFLVGIVCFAGAWPVPAQYKGVNNPRHHLILATLNSAAPDRTRRGKRCGKRRDDGNRGPGMEGMEVFGNSAGIEEKRTREREEEERRG